MRGLNALFVFFALSPFLFQNKSYSDESAIKAVFEGSESIVNIADHVNDQNNEKKIPPACKEDLDQKNFASYQTCLKNKCALEENKEYLECQKLAQRNNEELNKQEDGQIKAIDEKAIQDLFQQPTQVQSNENRIDRGISSKPKL